MHHRLPENCFDVCVLGHALSLLEVAARLSHAMCRKFFKNYQKIQNSSVSVTTRTFHFERFKWGTKLTMFAPPQQVLQSFPASTCK